MAKVKKFADGGISTLTGMLKGMGSTGSSGTPLDSGIGNRSLSVATLPTQGSGGSAQDGLGQIDAGAGTVRSAINAAQGALGGGGGGGGLPPFGAFKKGGQVKRYTSADGRLDLKSSGTSTAQKGKTKSNW